MTGLMRHLIMKTGVISVRPRRHPATQGDGD